MKERFFFYWIHMYTAGVAIAHTVEDSSDIYSASAKTQIARRKNAMVRADPAYHFVFF
jgi:hypothetical protein